MIWKANMNYMRAGRSVIYHSKAWTAAFVRFDVAGLVLSAALKRYLFAEWPTQLAMTGRFGLRKLVYWMTASSLRVRTSWHSFPRTLLRQSSRLSALRKDWHAVWYARAGRSFVSEIFQHLSCTSRVYISDALQKTGLRRHCKDAKHL